MTTEDGIYKSSITIPSMDWYAENILSVTGEYYGVEKTIEKEFTVFAKKIAKSSCHTVNPFSVADQETFPSGIAFNTDGTKMFIVGFTGDDVNEYYLSIPYCLSTAAFVDATSISSQDTTPTDIAFNSDGTKMFILGASSDEVNEYALSTAFDASTLSFTDVTRVNTQETAVSGIAFNTDGTKMFIVGFAGDDVNEYALSTGFDVSTRSFTDATSISSQETNPKAIAFNSDGTKMFIVGGAGDDVNEYALSTAFDASTRSFTDATSISSQETTPRGIVFSSDGTKMFIVGSDGDEVNEYVLTTAWDASTLSFK